MKAVMMSIQPYWVFLIIAKAMGWEIDQHKEIELRKTYPKADDWNRIAKIYCSKDKKSFDKIPEKYRPAMKKFLGKVIGHFVCDKVDIWECKNRLEILESFPIWRASYMLFVDDLEKTCLTYYDLWDYGKGKPLYAWHISDLVIYDEPKEIGEFEHYCNGICLDNKRGIVCEKVKRKEQEIWIDCNGLLPLTRPPQSWCYVEKE